MQVNPTTAPLCAFNETDLGKTEQQAVQGLIDFIQRSKAEVQA